MLEYRGYVGVVEADDGAFVGRVVDLRDVAYFGSIIAFFLYLNVESVENRRHA